VDESTSYTLDRPGAWGQFGFGILLVLVPLSLIVAFSIPGVFQELFPNAPKHRDPSMDLVFLVVALGIMGAGAYFLYKANRTLRDRSPKLEFTPWGVFDRRAQVAIEWKIISATSFAMEKTGDRIRYAKITLTVHFETGARLFDVDVNGLSKPPEAIFRKLQKIIGSV